MLPAIEKTNGTHDEDAVLAQIIQGQFKLWRNEDAGVVTEFTSFPGVGGRGLKCLNVFLAGGDIEKIRWIYKKLEPFAKENGVDRITALATPNEEGRERADGWARMFPGAVRGGTYMYKDLEV